MVRGGRRTRVNSLELRRRWSTRQPPVKALELGGARVGEFDASAEQVPDEPNFRPEGQPELLLDRLQIRGPTAEPRPPATLCLDTGLRGSNGPVLGQDP